MLTPNAALHESWREREAKREAQYQPKTGKPCYCRSGIERDNCPVCEGTGMQIDFAAIRARSCRV